jgi:hypothetical protein
MNMILGVTSLMLMRPHGPILSRVHGWQSGPFGLGRGNPPIHAEGDDSTGSLSRKVGGAVFSREWLAIPAREYVPGPRGSQAERQSATHA